MGSIGKKIWFKVRIAITSRDKASKDQIRNYDDEYYIPVSAYDSQWNGITFQLPSEKQIEQSSQLPITDTESEIKVLDLEKSREFPPLLLLFPDLKNTSSDHNESEIQTLSPTEVTKLLKGKKLNLKVLKPSKRLSKPGTLNTVHEESTGIEESTESEESRGSEESVKKPQKAPIPVIHSKTSVKEDSTIGEYHYCSSIISDPSQWNDKFFGQENGNKELNTTDEEREIKSIEFGHNNEHRVLEFVIPANISKDNKTQSTGTDETGKTPDIQLLKTSKTLNKSVGSLKPIHEDSDSDEYIPVSRKSAASNFRSSSLDEGYSGDVSSLSEKNKNKH